MMSCSLYVLTLQLARDRERALTHSLARWYQNVGFAESLGKDDEFISFMLEHFIAYKSTFEFALRLLEELLGARQTMFDLQHVGALSQATLSRSLSFSHVMDP